MTLVRWKPRTDLFGFQHEMNRLFDDLWKASPAFSPSAASGDWLPAVDVSENDQHFRLVAELPGVDKENVKISFSDSVVTIRGEKRSETREDKEHWHQVERTYGTFERSLHLNAPVNVEQVTARFDNGLLTIVLPKSEDAKPREISIDS